MRALVGFGSLALLVAGMLAIATGTGWIVVAGWLTFPLFLAGFTWASLD